jgi:hypothetical protein
MLRSWSVLYEIYMGQRANMWSYDAQELVPHHFMLYILCKHYSILKKLVGNSSTARSNAPGSRFPQNSNSVLAEHAIFFIFLILSIHWFAVVRFHNNRSQTSVC